jgi:hypothetical protein
LTHVDEIDVGHMVAMSHPVSEKSGGALEVRDLRQPEAVVSYPLGENQQVRLAGTVVSRFVLQPGWSWQEHARPMVGMASCH